MPDPDDEVTVWMQKLAEGEPEGAEQIWKHYYEKLVRYADRKLGNLPKREVDEEDIAASAMHSLHRGVQAGRFPQFANRDDLWKILLTITSRKASKRIRHQLAQKRGGGLVRGESVFLKAEDVGAGLNNFAGCEPTPEFAEMVSSECEELLEQLGDEKLREIALLKLQGYTNEEIAAEQGCAVRSIERKLNRIRALWADENGELES
jgi:DNA-directed RNA polymerase specialized sigma24 family protein